MNLNKIKTYTSQNKKYLKPVLTIFGVVICWIYFAYFYPKYIINKPDKPVEVFIASPTRALSNVKTYFPKSDVYKIGDEYKYTFYVVDSSGLKRVCCNHPYDDEISSIELMIKK